MSWSIDWTRPALRDLGRLDRQSAERVRGAVDRFAEAEQGDVQKLQGTRPPQWRLRVGEVRVRFLFDREVGTLHLLRVLPRGRAYRLWSLPDASIQR